MAEYIDRKQIRYTWWLKQDGTFSDGVTLQSVIDDMPTADVQEVKHGEWKECFEDWRKQIAGDECSSCGFQHYGSSIVHYHYCPNCGATMDGGKSG